MAQRPDNMPIYISRAQVTVNISAVTHGMKATLATGGDVTEVPGTGPEVSFLLDLGIADALILR